MSELVLSSAKQGVFKGSLLFLFELAFKIRFSLPLLLLASFIGLDFHIDVITEDDDEDNNDDNYRNIVYNLNTGFVNDDEDDDSDATGSMTEIDSFHQDLSDSGSDFSV